MHRWYDRRQALRRILQGSECVRPASTYDPISVRVAADLGFELGMLSGSTASLAVLGAPDLIVLTLSELAEQVQRISRASDLPVMIDADHGYGNALNVMRTVEELEMAGAAGLSIEDTDLPANHGSGGTSQFISIDEGVGKLKAALAARRDPDLVIAGRTDTPKTLGAAEARARAHAYAQTGVDAIFPVGVQTKADFEQITDGIQLPLILGGTGAGLNDRGYLAAKGVRVWLQGHQPIVAATKAIYDTMKHLRDGDEASTLANLASADQTEAVTRRADYDRWLKEYL